MKDAVMKDAAMKDAKYYIGIPFIPAPTGIPIFFFLTISISRSSLNQLVELEKKSINASHLHKTLNLAIHISFVFFYILQAECALLLRHLDMSSYPHIHMFSV